MDEREYARAMKAYLAAWPYDAELPGGFLSLEEMRELVDYAPERVRRDDWFERANQLPE